ncbi:MAG: hypothetical protein WEA09_15895 [Gemmatimonadota bacterium]
MEGVRQPWGVEMEALRSALLELETTTLFGPYAVDHRGYQTANRGVFIQWQEGRMVVVWSEDLATSPPVIPGGE